MRLLCAQAATVPKYIKIGGLLQKNPAYGNPAADPVAQAQAGAPPPGAPPSEPMPAQPMPPAAAPPPPVGGVPKYIKVNGVLQKNPAHPDNRAGGVPAMMAAPANALTPICTMNDVANQNTCGGEQIHVSAATESALSHMQDSSTLGQYAPGVNCEQLVDGLGEMFARYGGRSEYCSSMDSSG